MNDLIPIEKADNGALVVASTTIAGRSETEHRSVLQLIRNNLHDFEEFGGVAFEMRPFDTAGGTQRRDVVLLNEQQATLLLTYMRNSEPVRRFKKALVHSFYAMAQELQARPARELSRADLARMVIEQEEEKAALAATIEQQKPMADYHERFISEHDDIVTVDNFAGQYGSTGPTVRGLLADSGLATRKLVGKRWSRSKGELEKVYEWRSRQGLATSEWFDLRPQHDAPRLHNGQVRQTLYIRQYYAEQLAVKLGLAQPAFAIPA